MKTTRLFGLIGYPLGHSFSREWFRQKFEREGIADADYRLFPLRSVTELPGLIEAYPSLRGLNVTIPYKEQVLGYVDQLDAVAADIGAVNTLLIGPGGITGYNTDVEGLRRSLDEWLPTGLAFKALILGTGGAAKAAAYEMRRRQWPYLFVSRQPGGRPDTISYVEASRCLQDGYELLIQCTPVGMVPDISSAPPLEYGLLGTQHYLMDMVYNPGKTIFLERGESRGCPVRNGLRMLQEQAESAWTIWNTPPDHETSF